MVRVFFISTVLLCSIQTGISTSLHQSCLISAWHTCTALQCCCCFVPLLADRVARFGPLLASSIALGELYRTGGVREAVDGLPIGNRYPSAGLRKSVTFSQFLPTYTWTLSKVVSTVVAVTAVANPGTLVTPGRNGR